MSFIFWLSYLICYVVPFLWLSGYIWYERYFFSNFRCDSLTRKASCYEMSKEKGMICRPIINPETGESSLKESAFLFSVIIAYIFCVVFELAFSASKQSRLNFQQSTKLSLLIAMMIYAASLSALYSVTTVLYIKV